MRPDRAEKKRLEKKKTCVLPPAVSLCPSPSIIIFCLGIVNTQQVVEWSSYGGIPSAAPPCCTGGEGSANGGPAGVAIVASGQYTTQEQADILTKALLTIAGHLKS